MRIPGIHLLSQQARCLYNVKIALVRGQEPDGLEKSKLIRSRRCESDVHACAHP